VSALTFTLKQPIAQRVDMSPLTSQNLQALSLAEIAALTLQTGNRKLAVSELFDISGDDAQQIVIENSSTKLDYIGKGLSAGEILVRGDAGAYTGMQMLGGSIKVSGSAGLYTGCEMKNGDIEIGGNVGDYTGGALPGNKQGMRGGSILIKGNAGSRTGDHMRRGQILIEGDAGEYLGSRMIAGTIAVLGEIGRYPGYAMRRGTLLLWKQPPLPAYFNDCGTHSLAFLPLMFASFKHLDSKFADSSITFNRVQRYGGDIAESGRGEILVKV